MTWKPTDEMKEIAIKLLTDFHRKTSYAPNVEAVELLIAVQPLIAEQARIKALDGAARMIEYWSPFSVYADSIRSLIRRPPDNP